jgi:hypothetical protein
MNDDVFEQVLWLRHEFSIQADVASATVAAAPPSFHSLKKVSLNLHAKFGFPLLDQRRHNLVQQRLVPLVHDMCAFIGAACRANSESDAPMV